MHRVQSLLAGMLLVALILGITSFPAASPVSAATNPGLGTAGAFAVLGASTVTNTGLTSIVGDVGVSPGTAITGFPPGFVSGGTLHAGDATAAQAQVDVGTAYDALAASPCDTDLSGQNLGSRTLTPGTYCYTAASLLTGQVTLDAQGNPNAVFIFKVGSTFTATIESSAAA